jgi:hypothetical protein
MTGLVRTSPAMTEMAYMSYWGRTSVSEGDANG